jgi:hypothetical protein
LTPTSTGTSSTSAATDRRGDKSLPSTPSG